MVDLTRPCGKCGAVDRYSNGNCKPCQKKSLAKYRQSDEFRAKRRAYLQSDEGRAKIRAYRQSDEGRAKEREYRQLSEVRAKKRAYRQSDEGRAKKREYRQLSEVRAKKRAYRQSDEGRAKEREQRRKRRESATGYQKIYATKAKYKKRLFEFSLQNQQKAIEQCQQKNISEKEG